MNRLPNQFQLILGVIAELPDFATAATMATVVGTAASKYCRVVGMETDRYWKMPECYIVFLKLVPQEGVELSFDGIIESLGQGWQRHDVSEEGKWAVWNKGEGTAFDDRVRWMHAEYLPTEVL